MRCLIYNNYFSFFSSSFISNWQLQIVCESLLPTAMQCECKRLVPFVQCICGAILCSVQSLSYYDRAIKVRKYFFICSVRIYIQSFWSLAQVYICFTHFILSVSISTIISITFVNIFPWIVNYVAHLVIKITFHVPSYCSQIYVCTFHSFYLLILYEGGTKPSYFNFSQLSNYPK